MKHSPIILATLYQVPEIRNNKLQNVTFMIDNEKVKNIFNKLKIYNKQHKNRERGLTCFASSSDASIASVESGEVNSGGAGVTGELECRNAGYVCVLWSSGMESMAPFSDLKSKDKRKLPFSLNLLLGRALSPISPASETLSVSASLLSFWWLKRLEMLNERLLTEEELKLPVLSMWTPGKRIINYVWLIWFSLLTKTTLRNEK